MFDTSVVTGMIVAAYAFAVLALGTRPVFDNDIGIHIGVGRTIWENRAVTGHDFHSHTAPGADFLDHEWLARLLFFAIDGAGGNAGLVAFQALTVLIVFVLLARSNREHGLATALVLLAAGVVLSTRVQVRPHVIAWVLIALQIVFQKKGNRTAIAALLALWANIHGSFLLGVAMALVWSAERWWTYRDRKWFAWAAAFALAPMANPFGWRIYGFARQIKDINFFVSEWQPYSLASVYPWVIAAVFGAIVIDLIRRRENLLFDGARIALLAGLSWSAMRHGSEAMLYAAPIFAARYGPALARMPRRAGIASASMVAVAAVAGGVYLAAERQSFRFTIDSHALPIRAIDFINREEPTGEIFNDYDFGGYLLWKLDPRRKVFVDGRLEVYGPGGHLDEYLRVSNGVPGWQSILDKYGVNMCVVRADRPIAKQLDERGAWEMVYFDYNAAIFLRRGASPQIRRITNFRPWGHRDRDNFPVLIDEAKYLLGQNPEFFGGFKMLGFVQYRSGDYAGARDSMREYLRLFPGGVRSEQTMEMLGNLSVRGFGLDTTHGNTGGIMPQFDEP
ncbi:MAG: hypothetical protein IT350_10570 [Deltaproteobacteria bacterium]|nr:hypothetical protein [Deltaproteobacteria bacterium]